MGVQTRARADSSSSSSGSESDNSAPASHRAKTGTVYDRLSKKPTLGKKGLKTSSYLKNIEENPDKAKYWVDFANYLSKKGDVDRAERYFKRAIQIDVGYGPAW